MCSKCSEMQLKPLFVSPDNCQANSALYMAICNYIRIKLTHKHVYAYNCVLKRIKYAQNC